MGSIFSASELEAEKSFEGEAFSTFTCCSGSLITCNSYSKPNSATPRMTTRMSASSPTLSCSPTFETCLQRVGDHPIFGTVFIDPRNKYNQDLVSKANGKVLMRFYLDHADGFYKASFLSGAQQNNVSAGFVRMPIQQHPPVFTALPPDRTSKQGPGTP
mmetsp:Transcript_17646/g.24214  ORF Transcript_17646/g.24214 Transcript_17646/m.24214 type:complete len:159 (+) Transcript_17646:136-612(+)